MRLCSMAFLIVALLLPSGVRAQVTDVVSGYMTGKDAGTQPKVLMPWAVSTGTILTLTVLDHRAVTNNRVVSQSVLNAGIGLSVSWVVNRLWRPAPSPIRNIELRNSTEAYQDG